LKWLLDQVTPHGSLFFRHKPELLREDKMSYPKTEKKREHLPRREFLKGAALSAGAVAAAAVSTTPTPAQAIEPKASSGVGYQETDHVLTYYSLARF
jgi:hypothetical protein